MKLTPLLLFPLFWSACGQRPPPSDPQEAPRPRDTLKRLGVKENYDWNELRQALSASIKTPWSDSYYPFHEKGLAHRWFISDLESEQELGRPFTPFTQLQQLQSALDQQPEDLNLMSPGEKFDLLANDFSLPNERIMKKLKRSHTHFIASDYFRFVKELEKLAQQREEKQEKEQRLYSTFKAESQKKYVLQGDLRKLQQKREEAKSEEIIRALEKKIKHKEEELTRQSDLSKTAFGTWSQYSKTVYALEDRYEALKKEVSTVHIRPFAKELYNSLNFIPRQWATFLSGWKKWAYYTHKTDQEEDWSWMGHCHGWAAAALMEREPQHSVLVKKAGKEILFTEGDIRGLLTKVWADELPPVRLAGYRCEAQNIEKDESGRVVDGKICLEDCDQEGDIFDLLSSKGRYLTIRLRDTQETKVIVTKDRIANSDLRAGTLYNSIRDANFAQNGKSMRYKLTVNCRDTNPATLHQALYHFLHREKRGFVLDLTQSSEVWSHPVFKYVTQGMPIPRKDGSTSEPLQPVALSEIKDIYGEYRAPNTRFLVQLSTQVFYSVENESLPVYSPEEDSYTTFKRYVYTLELDKDLKVIGGEWGPIPTPDGEAHSRWAAQKDTSPDFLWVLPREAKPLGGRYDYNLLQKILACATTTQKERKTMKLHPDFAVSVPYAECSL